MKKVIYLGSVKGLGGVFCKAEIENGNFSISGVIAPLPSGNCRGSAGQIDSSIKEALEADELTLAPEWSEYRLRRLLSIWDHWHLNDMQAACEHQRRAGWLDIAAKKVIIYQWRLKAEVSKKQDQLKAEAIDRAASTESKALGFSPEEKRIMKLEYTIKTIVPELSGYELKYYEATTDQHGYFAHKEEKALGWLDQSEHPDGILGKECLQCGYKYGTAWLKAELPHDVIAFIEAMPEASKTPAWV